VQNKDKKQHHEHFCSEVLSLLSFERIKGLRPLDVDFCRQIPDSGGSILHYNCVIMVLMSIGDRISRPLRVGIRSLASKARLTVDDFITANPSIVNVPVKWGDMDAFNHINNTVYFKYFEEGRIRFFRDVQDVVSELDPNEECSASHGFMEGKGGVGPILAHTECFYKFPATYPDMLVIGAHIDLQSMTENTILMRYTAWSRMHQRTVAEGTGKIVAYDYATGKVAEFPQVLVNAFNEHHVRARERNLQYKERISDASNIGETMF